MTADQEKAFKKFCKSQGWAITESFRDFFDAGWQACLDAQGSKDTENLIDGIQMGISMLLEYIDKYHDYEIPENTTGPIELKELKDILYHLMGVAEEDRQAREAQGPKEQVLNMAQSQPSREREIKVEEGYRGWIYCEKCRERIWVQWTDQKRLLRERELVEALRKYLIMRRMVIEETLAVEVFAGNSVKESNERCALAEITAIECELNKLVSEHPPERDREQAPNAVQSQPSRERELVEENKRLRKALNRIIEDPNVRCMAYEDAGEVACADIAQEALSAPVPEHPPEREKEQAGTCGWVEDENGAFDTGCDHKFEFIYDGIKENRFKFCPYCGREIVSPVLTKGDS